jgi:hypothetical protein
MAPTGVNSVPHIPSFAAYSADTLAAAEPTNSAAAPAKARLAIIGNFFITTTRKDLKSFRQSPTPRFKQQERGIGN